MIVLSRIYTRTGDNGMTSLGTGERRPKYDLRVTAFGTVDETNAAIGVARLFTRQEVELDAMLERIQNDLFDLGADLCVPASDKTNTALRIIPEQVARLEMEIDKLNSELTPLNSFVLPGGTQAAAYLHLARTICRRAERFMFELAASPAETVGENSLHYINRLSDFLFVASRWVNARADGDILWVPGQNR